MSIRPVRTAKCGAATFRSVTFATAAAFLAFTPYAATAAGDDAPGVLSKMASVYKNAKSYQATIVAKRSGKTKEGKAFSVTDSQEVRYKAPNLLSVIMKRTGTGAASGKKPDGTPILEPGRVIITSDGKTLTIYSESRNQYVKQNAQPSIPLPDVLELLKRLPGPQAPGVSMASPTTVGGRSAFVVQVKPTMPPNLPPADQKKWQEVAKTAQPLRIMIDKQTYQLLGLNESANNETLDISFSGQSVNGGVAANAFSFTPPAGSKAAPTPPQQGGGAPGIPR